MKSEKYLSTSDAAKILGMSRIAVYKKIKSGEIKAERVGRGFVIPKDQILEIAGRIVGAEKRKSIQELVNKAVAEYGEAFRRLGDE